MGTAFNYRAAERQLEILKAMGCNGIRTSHNPPAPGLLDLCDKMGFIVMDEAFDMWKMKKNPFDYHLDWDQWHKKTCRIWYSETAIILRFLCGALAMKSRAMG